MIEQGQDIECSRGGKSTHCRFDMPGCRSSICLVAGDENEAIAGGFRGTGTINIGLGGKPIEPNRTSWGVNYYKSNTLGHW